MSGLMKKVLIIVGSLTVGGAERMICELTKNIDTNRFNISVLCYSGRTNSKIERITAENVNVFFLNETGKIGLGSLKRVFCAINEINPDVIHAHLGGMVYAVPWKFLHPNKALIITAHTSPQKAFNKKIEWLLRLMLRFQKRKLMVVAVSEANQEAIKKYFSISNESCKCINNGIDIDRFCKREHERFTFINVARQDENKNQIAMIRAIEQIKKMGRDALLILVGDGPCHEQLKSESNALGLSDCVIFSGQVPDPETYYAKADVYVQTSFREALPLSVLEAMASGLPIVATNVGGLKDVVDGNGVLIEAGDDEALLSAMLDMMDTSEFKYEMMAKKSKEIVKNYSSSRMAELYERSYGELLDK